MTDLQMSLADLPAQVGQTMHTQLEFRPDETWDSGVMHLPVGTPVALTVAATSIDDGVYVQVTGECALVGECVRCLDAATKTVAIDVSETYLEARPARGQGGTRPAAGSAGSFEVEGDELDAPYLIDRDQIDLEPLVRDAILGESDYQPLCRPDCPGLCPHCGIRLDEAPADHHHEFINPRFEVLRDFFSNSDSNQSEGEK